MLFHLRQALAPAVLVGLLLCARPAAALNPDVKDAANIFSPAAVQKAEDAIRELRQLHGKTLLVETFKTVPAGKADQLKDMGRARFFSAWAQARLKDADVKGVYVLVCMNPGHLEVAVDPETAKKLFVADDRDNLRSLLVARFKEKDYDKGLLDGARFVRERLDANDPTLPVPVANQVKDYGGFFSAAAVEKANGLIKEVNQQLKKNLVVETIAKLPGDQSPQVKAMTAKARDDYFDELLKQRTRKLPGDALHILICKDPPHVQVGVGPETQQKAFTDKDRLALRDLLVARLKEKRNDQALTDGLALVHDTVAKNQPAPLPAPVKAAVMDYAGYFSAPAVQKAADNLKAIDRQFKKPVVIETFKTVPGGKAQEVQAMSPEAREQFFAKWMRERFRAAGGEGIFVMICQDPRHVEIGVGPDTQKKAFTAENQKQLRNLLVGKFRDKRFDDGLAAAGDYLRNTLTVNLTGAAPVPGGVPPAPPPRPKVVENIAKPPTPEPPKVVNNNPPSPPAGNVAGASGKEEKKEGGVKGAIAAAETRLEEKGFKPIYLVWIGVGLLGLWILIGLLRAIFRPRQPQSYSQPPSDSQPPSHQPPSAPHYPGGGQGQGVGRPGGYPQGPPMAGPPQGGYPVAGGPGYGGGGGGGGGGSFMSSMLGGMFGAAAGNWASNAIFGRSQQSGGGWAPTAHGGTPAYPQQPPRVDRPQAPPSQPAPAEMATSGGDFGDDSGGRVETSGGDFDSPAETAATAGGDFGGDSGSRADAGGGGDFDQQTTGGGGDYGGGGGADFADSGADTGGGGDFGGGQPDTGGGGDFGGSQPDTGGDFGGGGGGGDFGGGGGDSGGGGGDSGGGGGDF